MSTSKALKSVDDENKQRFPKALLQPSKAVTMVKGLLESDYIQTFRNRTSLTFWKKNSC